MNNNKLNVLLTRPLAKSQLLAKELAPFVNNIEIYPLFDYQSGPDHSKLKQVLTNQAIDVIIFVSQAAVHFALKTINHRDINRVASVLAVGNATQQALTDAGVSNIIVPKEHTTEGLLALPELQSVSNNNVLIIRGNGGRETLRQQLQLRGANVSYNEVYKRQWLDNHDECLFARWQEKQINCVVATSNELLEKTLALTDSAPWLKQCWWIVASSRIAANAATAGLRHVLDAEGASNAKIIEAISKITHPVDINYD